MTDRKLKTMRLGRGLASLLGEDDLAPRDQEQPAALPITSLIPGPFQPRRDMEEGALEELTASIKAHGVLQPILVRPSPEDPKSFQIIAGERRWRASQRAGLHQVPVHIRTFDDATAQAAALIENLQRQDLNAIEEAEGLRRLAEEYGLTQEMVAISVGKSRSHIANTLRLLALPISIQADVRRGALSAGHARALLGHPDPAKAALWVLARGLNVRQTEALAKSVDRHPVEPRDSNPLLDHAAVERDLTATLGLKTHVAFDGRRGHLTIQYSSLDHLDGLIRLLRGGERTD